MYTTLGQLCKDNKLIMDDFSEKGSIMQQTWLETKKINEKEFEKAIKTEKGSE